ncbi:hypothetical protein [Microbispora sp. NPDC049633]|uniref:hypothetical protein n=1 Tax=Microbispora sp. NPDC049633 TaxID=3154355 RepID=UPI0034488F4E
MAPDFSGIPSSPWHVWRSDAGRWWATRARRFDLDAEDAGAFRTVDADTQLELARVIAHQESVAAVLITTRLARTEEAPLRTGEAW